MLSPTAKLVFDQLLAASDAGAIHKVKCIILFMCYTLLRSFLLFWFKTQLSSKNAQFTFMLKLLNHKIIETFRKWKTSILYDMQMFIDQT